MKILATWGWVNDDRIFIFGWTIPLRLVHAFLKHLIQSLPHKSTSLCWKICKTPPKCLRKERRHNFYSRCSIVVVETLCVSKYGKGVTLPSHTWAIRLITMHWIAGQSEHTVLFRTISFVKIGVFQKGRAERSHNNVRYVENNVFFFFTLNHVNTLHYTK